MCVCVFSAKKKKEDKCYPPAIELNENGEKSEKKTCNKTLSKFTVSVVCVLEFEIFKDRFAQKKKSTFTLDVDIVWICQVKTYIVWNEIDY